MRKLIVVLSCLIAVALAGGLAACGAVGIVADHSDPPAAKECQNPINPVGGFRLVYTPKADVIDTTPVIVNHYWTPHHWKDTIVMPGVGLKMYAMAGPSTCFTAFDSAVHHVDSHVLDVLLVP